MLALFAFSLALGADQRIVYDLTVNGAKVGTRELTVRYLPREGGERRVIEAFTELTVAGTTLVARTSGSSTPKGAQFSSSVDQGGTRYQVQGTELPGGGWRVITVDGAGANERTLGRADAHISSVDLMDPARNRVLTAPGPVAIVLVETGEVLSGTLGEGQAGQIRVGDEKVPVTRYTLDGPAGKAKFDLADDGLLLRSEISWLGGTVIATARAAPPPRDYGVIEVEKEKEERVEEEPL